MESLTTTIKFIAGGGANSTPTTSDFGFIVTAAIILLLGACAIAAIVFRRKIIGFNYSKDYISYSIANKIEVSVIVVICCLLALCFAGIGIDYQKALAVENGPLKSDSVIGTVDVQTGDVVFSEAIIRNSSNNAQKVQKFSLQKNEETDLSSITWKITIDDNVVYNNKIGEINEFMPFYIEANATSIVKVEANGISPELAKALIGKNVANGITSYVDAAKQYYTGTVMHPVENQTDGTTTDQGLSGATVKFMNGSTEVESTTTDNDGMYKFTKATIGTAGTIIVTKSAESQNSDDYGYSTDSFEVNTTQAEQITAHIGKIKSLSVKILQYDIKGTYHALQNTYWCPAFDDGSIAESDIKFFDNINGKMQLVEGTAGTASSKAYQMSDLTDLNVPEKSADNTMKAKFYAICKAGQTLHCYQVSDISWNDVFEITGEEGYVPIHYPIAADKLKDSFISSFSSCCTDPLAKTIYFDGSSDSASWMNIEEIREVGKRQPPTVNGVYYAEDKRTSGNPLGWSETYGGSDGGLFGFGVELTWSAVATLESDASLWRSDGTWAYEERVFDNMGIVLSRVFVS